MDEPDKAKGASSILVLGRRITVTEAVGVAVIGLLGILGGNWISSLTKDHELKIKLVEIGIGILRADPKEGLYPARRWAIRLIGNNAGAPFSPAEEDALVNNKLGYDGSYDAGWSDYKYNDSYRPEMRGKASDATAPEAPEETNIPH